MLYPIELVVLIKMPDFKIPSHINNNKHIRIRKFREEGQKSRYY
jgi:hypothetical protein